MKIHLLTHVIPYLLDLLYSVKRGENQKGVSDIFGEMEIYISNESS